MLTVRETHGPKNIAKPSKNPSKPNPNSSKPLQNHPWGCFFVVLGGGFGWFWRCFGVFWDPVGVNTYDWSGTMSRSMFKPTMYLGGLPPPRPPALFWGTPAHQTPRVGGAAAPKHPAGVSEGPWQPPSPSISFPRNPILGVQTASSLREAHQVMVFLREEAVWTLNIWF